MNMRQFEPGIVWSFSDATSIRAQELSKLADAKQLLELGEPFRGKWYITNIEWETKSEAVLVRVQMIEVVHAAG